MPKTASRFEFGRVDNSGAPASFVEYLDSVRRAVREHKRLSLRSQQVRQGDELLDLGCGPGDDARLLARLVGRSGHVVGVDNSEAMISEARRRAAGRDLPVEYRVGDAHRLDFPDDTFDGARAERVFQHLPDPKRALSELARVTRPGGRIVIGPDPDWETLVVDSSDRALTRRIKGFLCDSLASGAVAHELLGLVGELGLEVVSVTPGTLVVTDFGAADLMLELSRVAEGARDAGAIDEDERRRWIDDLRSRDEENRFFLALTGFITVVRSGERERVAV